jgi:hypothetical protein
MTRHVELEEMKVVFSYRVSGRSAGSGAVGRRPPEVVPFTVTDCVGSPALAGQWWQRWGCVQANLSLRGKPHRLKQVEMPSTAVL